MRKVIATLVVAMGVLAFRSTQAMAKEITVGTAPATCKNPNSATINGGIGLAAQVTRSRSVRVRTPSRSWSRPARTT